jgi:hypothetical protein
MAPVAQILVVSLAVVTLATAAPNYNENQFNALKELMASVQQMENGALEMENDVAIGGPGFEPRR